MVVGLGCCADTGIPAGKEGAALPAAHEVAGCSLPDAPPQSDHRGVLDCQGLGRCEGGAYLGIPEEGKGFPVSNISLTPHYLWQECIIL